jgi:hypothetical protein
MVDRQSIVEAELRTPRAAALAGIVFAAVFGTVIVLLRSLVGAHDASWITQESHRRELKIALELIPFAGIAFLWFIGVIRSRLGEREDKLFATVFLGSGLLFVAMLFTATAITAGLLSLYSGNKPVAADNLMLATRVARFMIGTLGIRMAAVFTLVVTNLGRRTGVVPTWLMAWGFVTAAALLIAPPGIIWIAMLFPVWVLILSLHILFVSFGTPEDPTDEPLVA